jgi:hypothetical protein
MTRRTDFIATLKASLHRVANVLNADDDADFERIVTNALRAMSQPDGAPLIKKAVITLLPDVMEYEAPADFIAIRGTPLWGMESRQSSVPWRSGFLCRPLAFSVVHIDVPMLALKRAPSASEMAIYGAECPIYYYAHHVLVDDVESEDENEPPPVNPSTVQEADMLVLLTRAQAEAVYELVIRNYTEPVSVMGGQDDLNGSPQQVYSLLIGKYHGLCRA